MNLFPDEYPEPEKGAEVAEVQSPHDHLKRIHGAFIEAFKEECERHGITMIVAMSSFDWREKEERILFDMTGSDTSALGLSDVLNRKMRAVASWGEADEEK